MKLKSRLFVLFLCFAFLSIAQKTKDSKAAVKPNIVVILTDDVGIGDISGYRKKNSNNIIVQTPEIDKLMRDGMHFTDAHSPTALCAPSRYSIMTGNNTYRSFAPWGVWGSYQKSPVENNDLTLGKIMKQSGYNTAFFGKWHLGGDYYRKGQRPKIYRGPRNAPELNVDITEIVKGPKELGFDYSFMYPAGIQDAPYVVFENSKWYPLKNNSKIDLITQKKMDQINVTLDKDEGLGDSEWNPFNMGPLLATKAVDYIKTNAGKANPFFMYYCTQAVHKPHTPIDFLDGKKIKGSTPVLHLDMIAELDAQMGMLVKALKEKGVYENTIFIFTSDNGGLTFGQTTQTGHRPSDIYRGGKNQIYEGGHRVPFIAVWPNKIPKNSVSNDIVSAQDILSTIGAVNNQAIPDNEAKDSFNLLPIMLGKVDAKKRKFLMIQGGTAREVAYREGDWKLIMKMNNQNQPSARELYNLKSSPSENNNLINAQAQKNRVTQMLASYNQIRNSKTPTKTLHGDSSGPDPDPGSGDTAPIGKIITLQKSGGDKKFVTTESGNNNQLSAQVSSAGTSEEFLVESHPKGGIALKSMANDKYIRVLNNDTNIPIRAAALAKGDWTQFTWKNQGTGKVALKSVHANKWIQASWNQNNAVLHPKGENPQNWETFDWKSTTDGGNGNNTVPIGKVISLRKDGGDKKFVTTESGNNNQLTANSASVSGDTQKFLVETHPKGGVALKALLNNKYIRVFGQNTDIAIRAAAGVKGDWTQFTWQSKGSGKVALKSVHANKWIQANWTQNNAVLYPKGNSAENWETFTFQIESSNKQKEISSLDIDSNSNIKVHQNFIKNNSLHLKADFPAVGNATITVYNLTGKQIYSALHKVSKTGIHTISMDINKLNISKRGVYILKMTMNNLETLVKIIK
ncbi:sulfatase-like hydrolase/transferase [Aquimarina sp. AD10]|uniref:sulfatase-like hydrolase/transferase n=1 Tax=Aquimarina sp. AD10 TaxID=1714849 RepID=UPI000EA8799E|nr:sulfatase-like hydrolase/transferase [Aquimarina sp. AD10]RKN01496.1 T9SS C-terminal target domain-containing protein [Aquimarina sp. AD10]